MRTTAVVVAWVPSGKPSNATTGADESQLDVVSCRVDCPKCGTSVLEIEYSFTRPGNNPSTPLSPQRVSKSYKIAQRQLLATISIGIRVKVNRFDARPV